MLNQLSESIYYLSNQNDLERPTLGLVCGDQYSLVVDAGNSPQHAKDFMQEVSRLDVPPVKYLVITHAHWDHFLGMNEYRDVTIITNRLTAQRLDIWRNYSYDDQSLGEYVESKTISTLCKMIIQQDIPDRDTFQLEKPDIVFDGSLQIDLGNKLCTIDTIRSTHTDDSTIVYVPDDKVIFLGDSVYSTTSNSLFHYKASELLSMIEDIQKYDAQHFLLGHESICDLAEMELFYNQLTSCCRAATSTSLDEAKASFERDNHRHLQGDELFFLQAFVNDRILQSS